ncbi:MAG: hypothetical protein KDD37_11380 [Bdellovibrionales bacterium]|nr:hypothetical protein [Bdellovibrionales bacterium]
MNFKKNVLIITVFLVAGSAQAELARSNNNNSQPDREIRACSSYRDFKLAPRGSICVTSKGGKFEVVANGIQDVASGLVISIEIESQVNHSEATSYCEQKEQRLPTGWPEYMNGKRGFPNYDSELVALEKRGLREAFSGDMASKYFWSYSIPRNFEDSAYFLDGNLGTVGFLSRGHKSIFSALCMITPVWKRW